MCVCVCLCVRMMVTRSVRVLVINSVNKTHHANAEVNKVSPHISLKLLSKYVNSQTSIFILALMI